MGLRHHVVWVTQEEEGDVEPAAGVGVAVLVRQETLAPKVRRHADQNLRQQPRGGGGGGGGGGVIVVVVDLLLLLLLLLRCNRSTSSC